MNRGQACMVSYEIILKSGAAKEKAMAALEKAMLGLWDQAEQVMIEMEELLEDAGLLHGQAKEKMDEDSAFHFIINYGYDHLKTTLILHDFVKDLTQSQNVDKSTLKSMYKWYH